MLTVPTDSLKRITRERKYAIEEAGKCLRDNDNDSDVARTAERLKRIRERFRETYEREHACLQKLQARVAFVTENVLEKARNAGGRRGDEHAEHAEHADENPPTRTNGSDPTDATPYVDVLIQEYVARQGYTQTLRVLQRPRPEFLPLLIDVEQYEELNRLVASIEEGHSCEAVLAWCGKHAAKLKKMQSGLVFQLHVQEFVHMLEEGRRRDGGSETAMAASTAASTARHKAIAYAKKHLSPYAEAYPDEFQRAAGLLVLRDILPESSPCVELFAERRWHDISTLLRRDYFTIHGLSLTSPLETHLTCGIAALQVSSKEGASEGAATNGNVGAPTPREARDVADSRRMDVDGNGEGSGAASAISPAGHIMQGRVNQQNDDPLRHPVIQKLAATVPSSKRTVSKLVCPVTGIVMEGNNQPVALPNGYVYGSLAVYDGLLDWNDARDAEPATTATTATTTATTTTATATATRIQCPCTGDTFSMDEVRKLFIV